LGIRFPAKPQQLILPGIQISQAVGITCDEAVTSQLKIFSEYL
jgi:hypothetical protein